MEKRVQDISKGKISDTGSKIIYIYNIYITVPSVLKRTIHCLISSNIKPIKAISIK